MMTMSRAISAGQALDYYKQEFTNSKDNYYGESGEVKGRWYGNLADEWNLKGEVTSEQYERLVAGQDPHTGEQLIRSVSAREVVDDFGKEKITSEHRAGWDATISAPKSVSLVALVGDDERVREAHRESVNETLKEFEKYMQARGGGDKPAITTGKMVAAQFEHTSSRPDRTNGYAAPQLHTHVVIFNMTQTEDGKVRSVQPLELYRSQQYATALYRAHLADKLQALGYEIRVDPRTGAPELRGFSEEYLQESSPRRKEVLNEEEHMKERREREGKTVSDNARLKQAAARNNRRSKSFDPAKMRERALEKDTQHGSQARQLVARARERLPLRLEQFEIARRALEAVIFARKKAVEKEAVADMRKVIGDALRRNLGLTTYGAVMSELQRQMQTRGTFIRIMRQQRPPETTTERMLAMEKENVRTMLDAKGSRPAMVEAERVNEVVTATAERQQRRLNAKQQAAIEAILFSRDQIIGLQGGAGTGKTTALSVLREAAEQEGYQVRGFAPSTRAAQQLGESGIETETIQKFLRRRQQPTTTSRLFVLDESSLASTKHIHKLFARLEPEDKVLLVGDVRQHQAVEAGRPFEQLQQHGMTTVELTENVRQQNKELKKSVNELAARNVPEAVAELHSRGKVIEIVDERERFEAIAQDYCKDPNTLVISPANRERVQLNFLIHRQLQSEGNVSQSEYQMKVYVTRSDMTGAERTFANSYRPGEDIIRYNRNSNKAKIGEYAQVIKTDHEKNEITVRFDNGRTLEYNPERLSGVSVYYESERAFAEGDRVQFRAPDTQKRIANGELGTITKIEPGQIRLNLDSGREISLDPRKFRHLDYGYAVTSHSAQGLTCDRVLVNADTRESLRLLNDRMAYVAISRARYDAVIYTDSGQNLGVSLDRGTNKETAIEATQQQLPFDHSVGHSPTHPEPAPTRAAEHATEIPIAIARAGYEVPIHSDAEHNLSETLNRGTNKDAALEATLDDDHNVKKDRAELTRDPLAPQQPSPTDHSLTQGPSHTDPAPTKAAELEIEGPEIELGALIL
jgi:conjugative relaxase-like TrwC/TraI family protein